MKRGVRSTVTVLVAAACGLAAGGVGHAQAPFSAKLPMAITSCGQSPDAYTVSLLATRMRLSHSFDNVLKPEGLAGVGTLVVVMGGSAKGLGEAGLDEKGELARVAALIARARASKAAVVAVHVGGESRRGPLSDTFLEPVVAGADYLVVTEEGNKDGFFTKASKARHVPLVVVKQTVDVAKELKALFPGQ
jgi:hypothetical protein